VTTLESISRWKGDNKMIINKRNVDILQRIALFRVEYSGGDSGYSHEIPNPIKRNF
jgi:hypothetical protein